MAASPVITELVDLYDVPVGDGILSIAGGNVSLVDPAALGYGNIDGGAPSTTFTSPQTFDGGAP